MRAQRSFISILCVLMAACGGGASTGAEAQPAASAPTGPAPTADGYKSSWGGEPMDAEVARVIVNEVEADWPRGALIHKPTSLDQVLAVLKSDQVNRFADAVAFVEKLSTPEALSLHAQIELAWAEAYIMLVDIMKKLHTRYTEEVAAQPAGGGDAERIAQLETTIAELERTAPAFARMIVEHLNAGARKAFEAKQKYPDNYLGYRVAGDFYRLVGNWDAFKKEIEAIRAHNPDSNGLLFLQGAAAFESSQDAESATRYYRQALERDPAFVRAQAHLLTIQTEPQAMYEELQRLAKLNPDHQLVIWAGWGIKEAYERRKAEGGDAPQAGGGSAGE